MSVLEFIILSIALSFEALIMMHGCAKMTPIKLTKGLGESFSIALVNAILIALGLWMGGKLRFTPQVTDPDAVSTTKMWLETDNLIYLGMIIFVAFRMLFGSRKRHNMVRPYDIEQYDTVLLLGIAIGINTFIVGLALGFRITFIDNVWRATIPIVIIMTLFAFLGVMFGRQKKELRSRRYTLIAVLLLLAFALKSALWG